MNRIFKLGMLLLFAAAPFAADAQRWGRVQGSPVTVYSFTENVNTAPEVVNIFYTTQKGDSIINIGY